MLVHREEETATATINSDGSISGWAAKRTMEVETFAQRFLVLKNGNLECRTSESLQEAPTDSFRLSDLVFASVIDDDQYGKDFMFVIQVAGTLSTWFLGIDSIEDMQLWLEVLQVQVRKNRVASVTSRDSSASVSSDPGISGHSTRRHAYGRLSSRRTSSLSSAPLLSARRQSSVRSVFGFDSSLTNAVPETFSEWAEANEFEELVPAFTKAGYDDLFVIAHLTDDEVKEMLHEHVQVDTPVQRMKIVVAVRNLRKILPSE
jgi:hypothetical protein